MQCRSAVSDVGLLSETVSLMLSYHICRSNARAYARVAPIHAQDAKNAPPDGGALMLVRVTGLEPARLRNRS